jgi:AraC-like DNA-binding protein
MTIDVAEPPNFTPSNVGMVEDAARPVLTYCRDLMVGATTIPHSHLRGQLLWAVRGVLRVISGQTVWIVPPSHAVWIPGGVVHHIVTETAAEARNLYIDPSRQPRSGGRGCAVLLLSPLMREMILRLTARDPEAAFGAAELRLAEAALDEIAALPEAPLTLPGARDARLLRLTGHLGRNPADPRPLTELATLAGASPRTLERLFQSETGLTFRHWRGRLRLLAAIERLERGESSTAIAYALGYRSPSAFVAAFRQEFGQPPQSFLRGGVP